MSEYIYKLELQNNKYYVGRTKNFEQRMKQHITGNGAAYTKKHGPPKSCDKMIECSIGIAGEETKLTLSLMLIYGINNVRGAEYCQLRDFKVDDCKRMAYAYCHHCGFEESPEEIEQKFIAQINNKYSIKFLCEKDKTLYEELRYYRIDYSKNFNVSRYLIFNNETLTDIVVKKPTTLEELSNIKGFDIKNVEIHGETILDIIKKSKIVSEKEQKRINEKFNETIDNINYKKSLDQNFKRERLPLQRPQPKEIYEENETGFCVIC